MSDIGNREIFAKNLCRYVEASGKTKKELAEIVGVAQSTFIEWTKGKKYPRMDKVEILANYFKIKKSDLIEKKSIENDPIGMAQMHFEMITDEDLLEIFEDFKKLDKRKRQIVKDLVHSLAESGA